MNKQERDKALYEKFAHFGPDLKFETKNWPLPEGKRHERLFYALVGERIVAVGESYEDLLVDSRPINGVIQK